ncbi:MAG: phosphodiester glycosidase family protein [Microgenomates group bacterium]
MRKLGLWIGGIILLGMMVMVILRINDRQIKSWTETQNNLQKKNLDLAGQLEQKVNEYEEFKKSDQVVINENLNKELKELKTILKSTIISYEDLIDLRSDKKQLATIDKYFAQTLDWVTKENIASASATLKLLGLEIKKESDRRAVASVPASGAVGTQTVNTNSGEFAVRVISADLRTTKVVVDTASDGSCGDNCPVMSLGTYAARSGAIAAINGPYFCPASYPACASKKNSFDTLMMNKNKVYFNSDNNVYSSVPAAIFSTTSRFVSQSSQWGRDTGVDSVIAGQPLLVFNGQSQFSGDGDPKKSGKGTRAFIGGTDNTVYIGLVYNCTVAEMANVVVGLGIKNAINLDSGGSIALWQNGKYLAGPGRDLPFGILLVRR